MWAAQLTRPGVLTSVDAPDIPAAALAPGEVLLQVLAGGICGSDGPKFSGVKGAAFDDRGRVLPAPPGYPMHEVVGTVLASRHRGVREGANVVGWSTRSNALAEKVVTSGDEVYEYDASFSPLDAVLIQPLACVLQAVDDLDVEGKNAAVVGLGPIGLLFAHAVNSAGAVSVTGVDPVDRSGYAARFGLARTVAVPSNSWAAHAIRSGDRPEVTIEAVGHQTSTLNDALRATADGGTVLYFGIPDVDIYPVDIERLMRGNLTLMGRVTRDRVAALRRADAYLQEHRVLAADIATHTFGRSGIQAAFDTACRPHRDRLKVLVDVTAP